MCISLKSLSTTQFALHTSEPKTAQGWQRCTHQKHSSLLYLLDSNANVYVADGGDGMQCRKQLLLLFFLSVFVSFFSPSSLVSRSPQTRYLFIPMCVLYFPFLFSVFFFFLFFRLLFAPRLYRAFNCLLIQLNSIWIEWPWSIRIEWTVVGRWWKMCVVKCKLQLGFRFRQLEIIDNELMMWRWRWRQQRWRRCCGGVVVIDDVWNDGRKICGGGRRRSIFRCWQK